MLYIKKQPANAGCFLAQTEYMCALSAILAVVFSEMMSGNLLYGFVVLITKACELNQGIKSEFIF